MSDEPVKRGNGVWPPFEPGNTAALRHGAYAVLALKPRAEEIAAQLRDGMGDLYAPRFEGAVAAAGMTGAQLERAMAALAEASAGDLRRLDQEARGWMRVWFLALGMLGLTPTSAARLGLDLARTGDALAEHLHVRYGGGEERAAIESDAT